LGNRRPLIAVLALVLLAQSAACGSGGGQAPAVPSAAAAPPTPTFVATDAALPWPAPTATPDPAKWRFGTARCPMPPYISVPSTGVELGNANVAFCVVWATDYPDETGFRVSVRYHEGGDLFVHTIPADEHDFVFPAAEAPVLVGPDCTRRRSFTVEVVVLRPSGEEPVGASGVVAECRTGH
jgi:hypothetical protein